MKVIVGAHAVMANGGVIAPVGLNMVALAAQRHAVPFVVLAGSHKVIIICWYLSERDRYHYTRRVVSGWLKVVVILKIYLIKFLVSKYRVKLRMLLCFVL